MLKIRNYIDNPKLILLGLLQKTARLYPDTFYVKAHYRLVMGNKLNLKEPKTFNEKLQWLKLYDRNPEYIQMVDKIAVKKYVANIIGEEYIIPTLGSWDKFEDIDFDKLPNQFVLKTNHSGGSSGIVICKDKKTLDIEAAKEKLNKSLRTNYFYKTREWPYKKIKPRILAETYLEDESKSELKDYKFFCFNGDVKYCEVIANRRTGMTIDFYDKEWNQVELREPDFCPNASALHNMPSNYNEMIEIAHKLSKGFPFIRIDLYNVNKSIYFGEMTFTPASGLRKFEPREWSLIFGNWIKLPLESNK